MVHIDRQFSRQRNYLRSDYSFMGDHYANPSYQPSGAKQNNILVNVRLGWRNNNWDAAIWVKNATDEAYSHLTLTPVTFSGAEGESLEAPRTCGLTVRYSF